MLMQIISWIIIGLVIGLLARFLVKGDDSMGWILTILVGIGGAVLGGWGAVQLGLPGFPLSEYVYALVAAMLLVIILRFVRK